MSIGLDPPKITYYSSKSKLSILAPRFKIPLPYVGDIKSNSIHIASQLTLKLMSMEYNTHNKLHHNRFMSLAKILQDDMADAANMVYLHVSS